MAAIEANMYDFNKVNMAQIAPLDIIALKKMCIKAMDETLPGDYWMLLNKERSDYTIFYNCDLLSSAKKGEELFATLTNRGKVIDFVHREDGAYEIWIRITDEEGEEDNFVYYFFYYNFGVVEV